MSDATVPQPSTAATKTTSEKMTAILTIDVPRLGVVARNETTPEMCFYLVGCLDLPEPEGGAHARDDNTATTDATGGDLAEAGAHGRW